MMKLGDQPALYSCQLLLLSLCSVLPPCPGSFPRTKKAGRQEPSPLASPSTALPSSEGCKRELQVRALPCWNYRADRDSAKASLCREPS